MHGTHHGYSSTRLLIAAAALPFPVYAETPGGKTFRVSPPPIVWKTLQRSFVLVILSLVPLLNSPGAAAQNNRATPGVLDMSLEDLMSIEIDSVYGASGFKQKV